MDILQIFHLRSAFASKDNVDNWQNWCGTQSSPEKNLWGQIFSGKISVAKSKRLENFDKRWGLNTLFCGWTAVPVAVHVKRSRAKKEHQQKINQFIVDQIREKKTKYKKKQEMKKVEQMRVCDKIGWKKNSVCCVFRPANRCSTWLKSCFWCLKNFFRL